MDEAPNNFQVQDAAPLALVEPGGMPEQSMLALAKEHGELGVRTLVFPDASLLSEWRARIAALS